VKRRPSGCYGAQFDIKDIGMGFSHTVRQLRETSGKPP
jgi:hypothetical protein